MDEPFHVLDSKQVGRKIAFIELAEFACSAMISGKLLRFFSNIALHDSTLIPKLPYFLDRFIFLLSLEMIKV